MRKYEVMYVIRPDLDQDSTKGLVEKFSALITNNGGEVEKVNEMGKRRLAYEMHDFTEGYYVLINFSAETSVIKELKRVFGITDEVIRDLIVKDVK